MCEFVVVVVGYCRRFRPSLSAMRDEFSEGRVVQPHISPRFFYGRNMDVGVTSNVCGKI